MTPLGTLEEWVSTYSKELDQETRQRCRAAERLLKETAAGRGGMRHSGTPFPSAFFLGGSAVD